MLTGQLGATSGDAVVWGHSVRDDLHKVKTFGIFPVGEGFVVCVPVRVCGRTQVFLVGCAVESTSSCSGCSRRSWHAGVHESAVRACWYAAPAGQSGVVHANDAFDYEMPFLYINKHGWTYEGKQIQD